MTEVGVLEATGNNDGIHVEKYLASVGFKAGAPWCAAFVHWVLDVCGIENNITAWSPTCCPESLRVYDKIKDDIDDFQGRAGDVVGFYYQHLGRIGHTGFYDHRKGDYIYTVEGNTNESGGRLGIGVMIRKRHVKTIMYVADHITPQFEC